MSDYAKVALLSVEKAQAGVSPIEAWKASALEVFPDHESRRDKGCPKCAFLGLAEDGLISGVPEGRYTRSRANKNYAVAAVAALQAEPDLAKNQNLLWERVMSGVQKKHNQQMAVVIALWNHGVICKAPV